MCFPTMGPCPLPDATKCTGGVCTGHEEFTQVLTLLVLTIWQGYSAYQLPMMAIAWDGEQKNAFKIHDNEAKLLKP